jgi:hypothetical protein
VKSRHSARAAPGPALGAVRVVRNELLYDDLELIERGPARPGGRAWAIRQTVVDQLSRLPAWLGEAGKRIAGSAASWTRRWSGAGLPPAGLAESRDNARALRTG